MQPAEHYQNGLTWTANAKSRYEVNHFELAKAAAAIAAAEFAAGQLAATIAGRYGDPSQFDGGPTGVEARMTAAARAARAAAQRRAGADVYADPDAADGEAGGLPS